MNCPACGQEIDPTQDACPNCGLPARSPWAAPDEPTVALDAEPGATGPVVPEPEPTLAFASPQQYAATHPAAEVPAAPPPPWLTQPAPRKRRLLLPILLLSLAVLVAGGGVAFAGHYFLGWFGGGRRPSDVLPGTAVTYVQVDLNPSLVQQASAWQFLRDLPQVKEATASGAPDPKAICWKLLAGAGAPLQDLDYERDLKPWLGDRFGVAVLPGKDPQAVVAIQVTDEGKARAALADLSAKGGTETDITMRSGYALLTRPADTSEVLAALDAGALSANQTFSADFASLGDAGILAGWADLAGMARLGEPDPRQALVQGRAVYSLGFTPDAMTLAGKAIDLGGTGITGTADLGLLPASTWAAVGFAGGGKALQDIFPTVESYLKDALAESGLEEADLVALLGRSFSIGASGATGADPAGGEPDFGVRIESDDVNRAKSAVDRLVGASGSTIAIESRVVGDVLLIATSPAYLDQLADAVAPLSTDPTFTAAVPDHAKATVAVYVKLPELWKGTQLDGGEYHDFLTALQGVGGEYVSEGADTGSWSLRVVRS